MSESPLQVWLDRDGSLLRLRLARPKANIVDAAMIAALDAALTEYRDNTDLRAVLLDHEGPHFSENPDQGIAITPINALPGHLPIDPTRIHVNLL